MLLLCTVLSFALVSGQLHLDSRSIMTYLEDEKLDTLVGFVRATGLDATLGDLNGGALTMFVPTEAAWNDIPASLLAQLATNATKLKSVLLNHVVNEIVIGRYLRDKATKQSLSGQELRFRIYPNGARTVNGAVLDGQDVSLGNGLVHKIGKVILTPDGSIGETVASYETDFKDLFGMLVLGRLFGTLETSGPFTLFAPTDAAFDMIQNNITALINDRDLLAEVLKYHVVPDTYWSAGLSDGMKLQTVNGQNLTVSINNNGVSISIDGTSSMAKVTMADMRANNGVLHVIDSVITG